MQKASSWVQRLGGNAWAQQEMFEWTQQEINVHAYDRFFGPIGMGAMPHKISFPCCSQFAVTRERIRSRSRFFWQQNMHFLNYNDVQASNVQPKHHMVGESFLPIVCNGSSGVNLPALLAPEEGESVLQHFSSSLILFEPDLQCRLHVLDEGRCVVLRDNPRERILCLQVTFGQYFGQCFLGSQQITRGSWQMRSCSSLGPDLS